MGLASGLFYSTDGDKQSLHRRITPTRQQKDDQKERWKSLRNYLVEVLEPLSECNIRSWLQGSYKFRTQIRPMGNVREFDIDLGIYFEWKNGPNGYGIEYTADEVREFTLSSLLSFEHDDLKEVMLPPKKRCMRVHFEGDFHVDVPVYHFLEDQDLRRLAVEGNVWENSDPKKIYQWFVNQFNDDRRRLARRLIRYLKCWAALRFKEGVGPSSILLTVLVGEMLPTIDLQTEQSDDEAFHWIVARIAARLESNSEVRNPVDYTEVLTDRMKGPDFDNFFVKLTELERATAFALDSETVLDAADRWSLVFLHFFPLPEEDVVRSITESGGAIAKMSVPDVIIRAAHKQNSARVIHGRNEIRQVPRDCVIRFTVSNLRDFPAGTLFEWTVRNEGSEAEDINDLGHPAGFGTSVKEHTAYVGRHYMDCVARHLGKVIGLRRIPVSITGAPMPPRNSKRPAYVRLR
ncbi:MAG: CBASS cGAMP synthase [Pseudomonadota bacterium]|nr:CBASS cGAMP synthase [Pseudomonadota bacterium]